MTTPGADALALKAGPDAADTNSMQHLLDTLRSIEADAEHIRDEEGGFRLTELADGTFSVGRCIVASIYVVRRLVAAGFDAWISSDIHPGSPLAVLGQPRGQGHSPVHLGLPDARPGGYPLHVTALCLVDGRVLTIDYTATQYGYEACPFIAELPIPRAA